MNASQLAPLRKLLRQRRRGAAAPVAAVAPATAWRPPGWPAPPAPEEPVPAVLERALADAGARHPGLGRALADLDPHQLAAVVADDRVAVVWAHVGSGKTRVLAHKVLFLHLARGVPLEDIVVVTFTQRAAGELVARLCALLGPAAPETLARIGTFHGVARALLERELPLAALGYRAGFGVLDAGARQALLLELAARHRLRVAYPSRVSRRLERLQRGLAGDDRLRRPDDLGVLAERYRDEKRARNLMDFDDLLAHATALLAVAPRPPRWVLVDELQDCEPHEVAFLSRLRGPESRLFAVGDPHQAIYGWRGGSPSAFADLTAEPGARVHALPRSYRSTATILDGARALLPARAYPLEAARGPGAPIVLRRHHNPLCEAVYLADRLRALLAAGAAARDIAVLHRVRQQAATLRAVLAGRGVPLAGPEPVAGDDDGVRLLTLHAAKGLEFRHVFIVGCNEGLLPLAASARGGEDEERRLLYVGMTRAGETLELSFTTEPGLAGARPAPSRFLGALPASAVTRDPPLPAPEARGGALADGDAVRHPRYGVGEVVAVDGDQVRCRFGRLGERAFSVRLCPLARA